MFLCDTDMIRNISWSWLYFTCMIIYILQEDYETFIKYFEIYDGDFELGVKLPSVFLPQWKKAKNFLFTVMKMACQKDGSDDNTVNYNIGLNTCKPSITTFFA